MEYVLKTTGEKVGWYTLKICGYVAGVGITIIVLRPVRQALFARLHGRSRNVYRPEVENKKKLLFSHLLTLSNENPQQAVKILHLGTGVLENKALFPVNSSVTCLTTAVYRNKDIVRLQQEVPDVVICKGAPEMMTTLTDNSYDAVVCCLLLCQVRDANKAIQEIFRVLRPGGKLLFMEHTQAKKISPTNRAQKRFRLWWAMLFYGCQLDKKVYKDIGTAGFVDVSYEKFTADVDLGASGFVGNKLNAFFNWAFVYLIGPHVMGVATKPVV